MRRFADLLKDSPPGLRSQRVSEVLRGWDGKTRPPKPDWRGPIELRLSLSPDVFAAMRQVEASGTGRQDWFMQAFACYEEQRAGQHTLDDLSVPREDGDDDELTQERLDFLRNELLTMRDSLLRRIRLLSQQGDDQTTGDEADHASVYQNTVERYRLIERAQAQLREVEAAIKRMEQGEYGYCEETGEPIGWQRLKVNPTARLSVYAQERLERLARLGA